MIKTSLDRIIQAARAQEPLYVTKLQEVTSRTRHSKLSYCLNIVCILWLIGLSVLAFFGGRYILYLSAITSRFAVTEAAPVKTNSTAIPYAYQVFLCYILAALTLYIIGHSIYLFWKCFRKYQLSKKYYGTDPILTKVYLEFLTPFRLASLYIDELCVPLDYLTVRGTLDEGITVKHKQTFWTSSLLVTWSDICLQHTEGIRIPLPPTVKVPRCLNHLITSILADPDARVNILLKCGPSQSTQPLKLKRPMPPLKPPRLSDNNNNNRKRHRSPIVLRDAETGEYHVSPPPKLPRLERHSVYDRLLKWYFDKTNGDVVYNSCTEPLATNKHGTPTDNDIGSPAANPPARNEIELSTFKPRLTPWYSMNSVPSVGYEEEYKQQTESLLALPGTPDRELASKHSFPSLPVRSISVIA